MDGLFDAGAHVIDASRLFDSLTQDPEIVLRRFGMHHNSYQNRSPGKHLCKTSPNLRQKVLPSVIDPIAAQVDAQTLKVRACVPKNLDDVGGQKAFPRLAGETDNA